MTDDFCKAFRECWPVSIYEGVHRVVSSMMTGISGASDRFWSSTASGVRIQDREYTVLRKIAEGGFSYVYAVRDNDRGNVYAMKRVLIQSKEQMKSVKWEVEVHRAFKHPNLLPLVGYGVEDSVSDSSRVARLLFPLYTSGSLEDALNRKRNDPDNAEFFGENEAVDILSQICRGVREFHKRAPHAWAHRDIKPGNVLIRAPSRRGDGRARNQYVLMDFGSTAKARELPPNRAKALELQEWASANCSMPYRPPELFDVKVDVQITESTDMWSLGCVLYALVYGYSPFECAFDADTGKVRVEKCSFLRVINGPKFPKRKSGVLSSRLRELVEELLSSDAQKRPTIHALCKRTGSWGHSKSHSASGP